MKARKIKKALHARFMRRAVMEFSSWGPGTTGMLRELFWWKKMLKR